ncbi:MAG: polysaccharide export protein [Bradyrhizobium sp.]|uniref:polysaccharide biosynthesis/export family protein n=1 Tax=Bradyrhizobium sp. TaxID=376 RepID=UPI001C29C3D0|nr:polysaccharide biosynthesis/export family protein [Bradyrhizobium sp.]MBU6461123.1 polysaccharide export protein [Pseudomonadota bacterium]MDE2066199.1 polysaccharide export protein [Bradyrhizobium sp.]MDE2472639.1 polysaccharide export protein [Bradyrhizobium sp.]
MVRRYFSRAVFVIAAVVLLGGCALVPASGPADYNIRAASSPTVPYALVKLTTDTVSTLGHYEPRGLSGVFPDKGVRPANLVFGIGDVVSVTIFEAAAGGLFIPTEAGVRPGNFVTIPDQVVDNDGNISVPYAGAVKAAGRTNGEIQAEIVNRIKNRAIEPQVVVSLTQQRTSLVSVFGEVNTPVRYPAAASGAQDRITDAITRAGGIKGQGYETWVLLQRGKRRATVPFANLVYEPSNNIFVQPGDRIYVYREQQKFLAFGASGQQGEFNFDAWRINLAEAVGKAGGLVDVQADPASVFLYRLEPREVAELLGVDVAKFTGELIPVIFSINFRDPGGYFLATQVQMRNQDVLFAANSPSVDVTKFLTYINTMMATANNGVVLGTNGIILYNSIKALNGGAGAPVAITTTFPP